MSELSSDQKEEIKKRNDELALGEKITELQDLESVKNANNDDMEASKKVSECLYMESQK